MNEFKKLTLREFPNDQKKTKENHYWSLLKSPVIIKEFASVTSCNYSSQLPHDFAITASTRVQIYSHQTQSVKKTISRFKDTVNSCQISKNAKLLVAADNSGLVQLFDLSSRAILRSFLGHKGPTRVSKFMHIDNQILSASDDNTVKIWDIHNDEPVLDFTSHTDYVRCAAPSKTTPFLLLSGSYDHQLMLHDTRQNKTTIQIDHGQPIESGLFLKGDGLVCSAGGNKIKIWDLLSGGRLVQTISIHQKNITSMCLDGSESYLFSGSLDHMVKVVSLVDYKVVHTIKYPQAVLCVDVAKDDSQIAVGMTNGLLSIRKRFEKTEVIMEKVRVKHGTKAYFQRTVSDPQQVFLINSG